MPPGVPLSEDDFFKQFNKSALNGGQKIVASEISTPSISLKGLEIKGETGGEEVVDKNKEGKIKQKRKKKTEKEIEEARELASVIPVQKTEKGVNVESEEYKNASIDIYRTLLMLGEVPFLEGFSVRGKELERNGILDFCMKTLVQHGVDTNMGLAILMTSEDEEKKREKRDKILDLRAFVLGVDKQIEPKAREWLDEIGVDEARLKSIKGSVDEKYKELFEEEEEYHQRRIKEKLVTSKSETVNDKKPFYNPVNDLKIIGDLVEGESGFLKLGEVTDNEDQKKEARQRLVDNGYDLDVVDGGGKELVVRLAQEIETLMSLYVESWVKSKETLETFLSGNAEKLRILKEKEFKEKYEEKEPVFYDQIFEDLYLSTLETESAGKNEAIERLRGNGIKEKQYGEKDGEQKKEYLRVLAEIHENKGGETRGLEWVIVRKHRLDKNEDVREKYKDIIEKLEEKKRGEGKSLEWFNRVVQDIRDYMSNRPDAEVFRSLIRERLAKDGLINESRVIDPEIVKRVNKIYLETPTKESFEANANLKKLWGVKEKVEKSKEEVQENKENESIKIRENDLVLIANDLYVVGYGSDEVEEDKKKARERLKLLGIEPLDFGADRADEERLYRGALERVSHPPDDSNDPRYTWKGTREGAVDYIKQLFKFVEVPGSEKTESYLTRVGGKKEKGETEGEKRAELVWDKDVLRDLDLGTRGKEKSKQNEEAWERLHAKGFFLKEPDLVEDKKLFDAIDTMTHKGNRRFGDFTSKGEAEKFLKDYFGVVELEELSEKKNEERLKLDDKVDELVAYEDKVGLADMKREDVVGEDAKKFYWAIKAMVEGDLMGEFESVDKAREYFMARVKVDREVKGKEKDTPEPEVQKKEGRRMDVGEMFAQYEKVSMNKDLWKKWQARIEAMDEASPERAYAIKQLQATIYLYNNPLERIKHDEYWRLTGMAILRDLRAIDI